MAESLVKTGSTKTEQYIELIQQLQFLVGSETNSVANLANVAAGLKEFFDFFWVGFYLVQNEELVLGPFQGPIACMRIAYGKGVCGSAWQQNACLIVPNVEDFPGHIACSAASKSEIVLPLYGLNQQIIGVLDVDSEFLNHFDAIDEKYLGEILRLIRA